MQLFQFDNEVYIYLFRVQFLHQFAGCFHCSARSQKVVVQQYYIVRFNGILVDLYRIFAVLFVVAFFDCFRRQLSGLAHGYESCT